MFYMSEFVFSSKCPDYRLAAKWLGLCAVGILAVGTLDGVVVACDNKTTGSDYGRNSGGGYRGGRYGGSNEQPRRNFEVPPVAPADILLCGVPGTSITEPSDAAATKSLPVCDIEQLESIRTALSAK